MSVNRWIRGLIDGFSGVFGRDPEDTVGVEGAPTNPVSSGGDVAPDPAHAPGHRHRGPPPPADDGSTPGVETSRTTRNQPWVRTTHSDSQKRRPRG